MRKLHYVMHISLDGYHADAAGNMHWVHMDDFIGDWVDKVIETCDTVLYGRVTYEMMAGFWPTVAEHPGYATSRHLRQHAEWVNPAKKIVVTRTLHNPTWQNTQIIKGDVVGAIKSLKEGSGGATTQSGKNIVMLGSASLAQLLMSHNLIDDYWLTINPVTLGAGQSLFRQPLKLKLIDPDTRLFPNGSIGVHYTPA
jgi:dihydrofolate reductase